MSTPWMKVNLGYVTFVVKHPRLTTYAHNQLFLLSNGVICMHIVDLDLDVQPTEEKESLELEPTVRYVHSDKQLDIYI